MTPVHDIVAAIRAEESIYNTVEDPAIQDASWHRLQALQTQLSAAIREARGEVIQHGREAKTGAR
jgi:hypothetical protein